LLAQSRAHGRRDRCRVDALALQRDVDGLVNALLDNLLLAGAETVDEVFPGVDAVSRSARNHPGGYPADQSGPALHQRGAAGLARRTPGQPCPNGRTELLRKTARQQFCRPARHSRQFPRAGGQNGAAHLQRSTSRRSETAAAGKQPRSVPDSALVCRLRRRKPQGVQPTRGESPERQGLARLPREAVRQIAQRLRSDLRRIRNPLDPVAGREPDLARYRVDGLARLH
jgi:hypothetical protein